MKPDKKALRILFDTYWTPQGWRRERFTPPDDLAYAMSKNVMFDNVTYTHNEAVSAAIKFGQTTSKSRVAAAFVSSLGSRRLELRSALGSFAVTQHLKSHNFAGVSGEICRICGSYSTSTMVDRNVLNFERFKWGGVRHLDPIFAATDLALFAEGEFDAPTANDYIILADTLDIAASMPSNAKPNDLDKCLAKVFPSNSAERRTFISILSYCGILTDPSKGDFRIDYPEYSTRDQVGGTNDWQFPAQWWRGRFGVDSTAVQDWFPQIQVRRRNLLN